MRVGIPVAETELFKRIKNDPRVKSIDVEEDMGEEHYWVELAPKLHWDECHGLHETSLADVLAALARVKACTCRECA